MFMYNRLALIFVLMIVPFVNGCIPPVINDTPAHEVAIVDEPVTIRLLALKHSHISIAHGDANLGIKAVNTAKMKGLDIQSVGNHNIDKNGQVQVWQCDYDLDKLKTFISSQMKINAKPGDTLIVFTIGHGFPNGTIQNLGKRADVMKVIAEAAEENQQRTLWWQLSCYACAGLPNINTLPPPQQQLFTMLASSTAQETSADGVQGRIMEKLFLAINDKSIDQNRDGIITARELKDFLNSITSNRRGDLFFTANQDQPIFGGVMNQAREIPIRDRNSPQGTYSKQYIPLPGGR